MKKLDELPLWSNWKRPDSIPYPNTWHTFTAKSKSGENYRIKIVDPTPDRFEEADEYIMKYFYPFEPICRATNVLKDDVSLHSLQLIQKAISSQRASLIAVLDEDVPKPRIVGVQKLIVDVKGDKWPDLPGDIMHKVHEIYEKAESSHNVFEMFGVDIVIRGFGLCVDPEFNGLGIGLNLIRSIEKISKTLGIRIFQVGYTNIRSQILAEKAGFRLLHEIVYDDYKDEQGRIIIPVVGTKSFKWGIIEYA